MEITTLSKLTSYLCILIIGIAFGYSWAFHHYAKLPVQAVHRMDAQKQPSYPNIAKDLSYIPQSSLGQTVIPHKRRMATLIQKGK